MGPVARSLGGTGRAALSGSEGPFLNPASVAHYKASHLAVLHSQSNLGTDGSDRNIAGLFIDTNPESIVPGALMYTSRQYQGPAQNLDQTEWQAAFGKFVTENLSFGMLLRYFSQRDTSTNNQNYIFNGDFGLLFTPAEHIGVALVTTNVLNYNNALIYPSTAIGLHYIFPEIVRVRFDAIYPHLYNPRQKGIAALGFEFPLQYQFYFRLGARADDVNRKNFGSVGMAWEGPKIGFDYAFEKNWASSEELTHAFDLRIYF